jgi:hypothetical protein
MSEQAHRLVVTPGRIRVGGLVFGSRSSLAGSTVAMKPHPGADREQKREERKQREAQMKGHKKLPTTLPYFRRSFHGVRATNGQLRRIALIYGEENAEAFVTRFQWAIDLMIVYDPAISDWRRRNGSWQGWGRTTGKSLSTGC